MENQRAPKLALVECGMDVGFVFCMYDALQIMILQLRLQVGECRFLFRRVPKFVLQLAVFFGPITAMIISLGLEDTMISKIAGFGTRSNLAFPSATP